MNRPFTRLLSIFLLLAASLAAQSPPLEKASASPAPGSKGSVAVIPLKGEINAAQLAEFKRAIAQAEADGATGIVVEIDTFGGRVDAAMEEMDALLATRIPTAAFVNARALSGGSLVALATDKIYLHPNGTIGASAALVGGGTDVGDKKTTEKATEKVVNKAREVARAKGHPEDVAEAFVRTEAEVKRGEKVIDGPTTLLTLNATDAANNYYGHTLLAAGTATDAAAVAKLAGFAGTVPASAAGAPASPVTPAVAAKAGPIFVIPLKGEVSEPQFYFLRRALKEAQRANASAVILEIDTFGGRVDAAMEEMDALLATSTPTYAFVNTKAISAGSMVSLATKKIYMHPSAVIGASAVVSGGGEDLNKTMSEKATSMVVAKARGAARANGHAEDVAEAFVRTEAEVTRDGKVIDSKTILLTLNAADATKVYEGKPLLAAGTASTVEDVVRAAGLTGAIQQFEPSGFETLAFWITMISPLLLIGGLVGAYIEMKAPGFGIPGICSLICFALFFGGHFVAGLAGMESVIVFVIGLALVIIEIFVVPGTIIPGIIGTLMMLLSLVWAMVDHWPSSDGNWSLPSGDQLERPILNLIIALVGTSVAIMLLARFLPKTAFYRRLVLADAVAAGPGISVPVVNTSVLIGATGKASTTLRPAGKAEIGGEVHDVVSAGDFIPAGTTVRVISADGMRIVVEPV
jgi:membrane-bound serine protease (ClpP class)